MQNDKSDALDSRGSAPGLDDRVSPGEKFRVRFALAITGLWIAAFGKQFLGLGSSPPPELSAAFAAVVAYILRSGSKERE